MRMLRMEQIRHRSTGRMTTNLIDLLPGEVQETKERNKDKF